MDEVKNHITDDTTKVLLSPRQSDGTSPNSPISRNSTIHSLKVGVEETFKLFSKELCQNLDNEQKDLVRSIVLDSLANWNISTEIPCTVYVNADRKTTDQHSTPGEDFTENDSENTPEL